MNYYFIVTLYLSVLFPSILGLARFKKIDSDFYPFLYFLWLGCLNVIFGLIITHMGYYTIVNFNFNVFLESFILLWLFKNGICLRHRKIFIMGYLFYIQLP